MHKGMKSKAYQNQLAVKKIKRQQYQKAGQMIIADFISGRIGYVEYCIHYTDLL
jgi:hypothetical protein